MADRQRVIIVGGGISGLATSHFLRQGGATAPHVTLVEAGTRLGGKILTERISGHDVDAGPDALMVRVPALRDLIEQLGLGAAIVEPGKTGSFIWSRGRLRPLPEGMQSGVPTSVRAVLRSELLSPLGLVRAALDLVLPRRALSHDPSVGAMLRPRFGGQVFRRLVDPLLGGVHAGSADHLSARSVVPDLFAVASRSRSLWWGMSRRPVPASSGPLLVTLRGGLSGLVDALATGLESSDVRVGIPAVALEVAGAGYSLRLADGTVLEADAIVLASPAYATADLLEKICPAATAALREIPYVDVATLTMTYPVHAVTTALERTGFLVPPEEGKLLVGCTWLPAKWPHLSDADHVLLRAMVGRYGDTRFLDMSDDTLVERVHDELASVMGLSEEPSAVNIQRWPRAMPQYTVGHQARLDAIAAALTVLPGIHVTGAAYRGLGISGCVTQAQHAADAVLADLASVRTSQQGE